MVLKALELQGFKSFPDKTVLEFDRGMTAVVGPNGSGKSNISDAILWVMGEQSTKTLRGAKMEDVIFGGTQKRSAVGFAEATLTLDNTDRALAYDADEVMVKPIGSLTLTLPNSIREEDIQSEITLYSDTVEAPVAEGQVLGSMRLFYEDQEYGELDLVAVTSVERSELLYKKMVFLNFMEEYGVRLAAGIFGVLVLILLLIFLLRRNRRPYRSSRHRGGHRNYRGSRR